LRQKKQHFLGTRVIFVHSRSAMSVKYASGRNQDAALLLETGEDYHGTGFPNHG
jgi:hypothetical protein